MLAGPALAAAPAASSPLTPAGVVAMPGIPPKKTPPPWSADISWVDGNGTYYLADRTTAGIDVVDTNNQYVKTITGGFVGVKLNKKGLVDNDHSGPNGLLVIDSRQEAWAGDGNSTAKVVDLAAGQVVASISTGGKARADELAYDPRDGIIVIANDADDPPFLTFINVASRSVMGNIQYPNATNGIEQPLYNPVNGMFYVAVPQTTQNPGGQIDVVDPRAGAVVKSYPVSDCVPHGLAMGPSQQMLLGCSGDAINLLNAPAQSQIMDATNGSIVAVVKGIGGSDEVWYDNGGNRYYLAASSMTSDGTKKGKPAPVLGAIDASTFKYLGGAPTAPGAHSTAADPLTGRVFIPVPTKGLTVFNTPGLARGTTITNTLAGVANGAFDTFRLAGDGGVLSVAVNYNPGGITDKGLSFQVSGPTGVITHLTGNSGGQPQGASQGAGSSISIGSGGFWDGTVINSQPGAFYQAQIGNYNPGFTITYTLTVS